MREVVLDTETTGLEPAQGHRIIEIGCIELKNRTPTRRRYHTYVNPQRDVPLEAQRISNIAMDMLGPLSLERDVQGAWPRRYLIDLKHTIAGGTSEIQRNIVGERVLGLPRGR